MGKNAPKLYWIECSRSGPEILVWPFEIVGFEVRLSLLDANLPLQEQVSKLLLQLEDWVPDVVLIWYATFVDRYAGAIDEPKEVIDLCQRIRKSNRLRATKIMAYVGGGEPTAQRKEQWANRYDFFSKWPLNIIEHAKIAKRLAGQIPDDLEGIVYFLSKQGGWEIENVSLFPTEGSLLRFLAKGSFTTSLRARTLRVDGERLFWEKDGIHANRPTAIVCLVKDQTGWKMGLNQAEIQELGEIGEYNSGYQLLLGVNSALLEAGSQDIRRIIDELNNLGNWKIFIIEHMWQENQWLATFDNLLYERENPLQRTRDVTKLIVPYAL